MNPRAAAIIIEADRLLLIHRIRAGRHYYTLPGGTLEEGETSAIACHREIKEETGLDIRIEGFILTLTNRGRTEHYFRATPTGGTLALGGNERILHSPENQYHLEWTPLVALARIDLYPTVVKDYIIETYSP